MYICNKVRNNAALKKMNLELRDYNKDKKSSIKGFKDILPLEMINKNTEQNRVKIVEVFIWKRRLV